MPLLPGEVTHQQGDQRVQLVYLRTRSTGAREHDAREEDKQGSKKYRTYDRAVVAKQGCLEDAHVSELIIPHN